MTWWNPVTLADVPPPPLIPAGESPASVVTPEQYQDEFGKVCTQAVLDAATESVESELKRPLRNAVWTHRVRIVYDGYVDAVFGSRGAGFPPAIPIQQVFSPDGTVLVDQVEVRYLPPDDITLGFWGLNQAEQWATVRYQGGWTPETLPSELREVICKVATRRMARRNGQNDVPMAGVGNPKVGDVSFSTDDHYGGWFDASDRRILKKYRYREIT